MKLSEVIACVRSDTVAATRLVTVAPKEPLSAVASKMQEQNVGAVIVVEGAKPTGIITDRDLALAMGARGATPQTPVQDVMTSPVRTIPDGAGIFAATQCIRDAGVRRLPIVDKDGRAIGIVSLDDVLRLLGKELYNLIEGVGREIKHGANESRARSLGSGVDPQ